MKIPKRADITDLFKCPRYPDLKPITYKVCRDRPLTKLAGGGDQYPECSSCSTGKIVTNHFKNYQRVITPKGKQPNWNTDVIMIKEHKKKVQTVKAQIEMVIDLLVDNKLDSALIKLGMILEEM